MPTELAIIYTEDHADEDSVTGFITYYWRWRFLLNAKQNWEEIAREVFYDIPLQP